MTISIPHHEVSAGIIRQIITAFPDAPQNWRQENAWRPQRECAHTMQSPIATAGGGRSKSAS
jgi:hypothetical protein